MWSHSLGNPCIVTLASRIEIPYECVRKEFDMTPAPSVVWFGTLLIIGTMALYVIFW